MEINGDMITQFGLMNKISTGNPVIDVIICLLIPFMMQRFMPTIRKFMEDFFATKPSKPFSRTIEFTQRSNYYYYSHNDDPPTSLLQKAILAYFSTIPGLAKKLEAATLELLQGKKEVSKEDDDTSDSDSEDAYRYDEVSRMQQYNVNVAPPFGSWVEVVKGIRFMREEEFLGEDKGKKTVVRFWFETDLPDGNEKIDELVRTAFQYYKDLKAKKRDNSRYLYMPTSISEAGKEEGAPSGTRYKRYKLSEERSFKTLFHPDKDSILNLVENFQHKRGKFSIVGYPQKLGFLLHGPPGTGKTTFIKVLAQHTGRSVVSIPLARIKTNQELMDIMFDQKCIVEGEDLPVPLPFDKTIFVMEDVDAASNVVNKRNLNGGSSGQAPSMAAQLARRLEQEMMKQAQAEAKEAKDAADDSSSPATPKASTSGTEPDLDFMDDIGTSTFKKPKKFGPMMFGKGFDGDDELTLAGLLNVLDGVVDTPNRIIILTTNHPEKLDPALIRPGRVNKKIYMGRMRVEEALQMIAHYYGELKEAELEEIRGVFVEEQWSPAELESMCADFDTVREFIDSLAEKYREARAAVVVVV